MHRFAIICFLWILIHVVSGTDSGQQTNNGINNALNKANDINKNKMVEGFKNFQPHNKILEVLKQYQSERHIIKPEVQKADETEAAETLESVLVKRLLLGREMNSALDQWLIDNLKKMGNKEKQNAKKGWGNNYLPH